MTEPQIARRCPQCGASIREVAHFCPQCGRELPARTESSAVAEEAALAEENSKDTSPLDEPEIAEQNFSETVAIPRPEPANPAPSFSDTIAIERPAPEARPSSDTVAIDRSKKQRPDDRAERPRGKVGAQIQRVTSAARVVEGDVVQRVNKVRKISGVVIDEASYDPSLRFVLVAAVAFVLFLVIVLLNKLIT